MKKFIVCVFGVVVAFGDIGGTQQVAGEFLSPFGILGRHPHLVVR